jgi:hypothetical protein
MRPWQVMLLVASCAKASQSRSPDAPHSDAAIDVPPGKCAQAMMGMLATWSFIGESGSQPMTAATNMAAGVTASAASRSSGLTVASGVGSINSSGWPTAAQLDSTKYYTVSVTPPFGCVMDLSAVAIDSKSSTMGPTVAAVATSDNNFTQTTPVTVNTPGTSNLAVTGASGMVEVRVFGYSAMSASGTYRIENALTLSGALR